MVFCKFGVFDIDLLVFGVVVQLEIVGSAKNIVQKLETTAVRAKQLRKLGVSGR